MGKIGRGWQMTKMSLRVIRKDKEILIFPVLSGIFTLLILGSFIGGMFFTGSLGNFENGSSNWVYYVFLFLFYLVSFFIAIFFNAAIIGCATIRMNGGDPTVSDGFRIAGQNVGRIFEWALVAATVGLVIKAIQERVGLIGKLIMGSIGVAWTIVTYFVVPVLIYEKVGPWGAVKRSASILKNTWGEALVGNLGMGIIFVLLGVPGLLGIFIGIAGFVMWGAAIGVTILAIAIIYLLVLAVVNSAAETVLVAALYRYATTGKVSEEFEGFSFQQPFTR
jgi:hypothetical protein